MYLLQTDREIGFWEKLKLPVSTIDTQSREQFWRVLSSDELADLIRKEPLTPCGINAISRFVEVDVFGRTSLDFEGIAQFKGIIDGRPFYSVGVNVVLCKTAKMQREALLHELSHVYYRTNGAVRDGKIETIIQNETLRFLSVHKEFVNELCRNFLPVPGFCYRLNSRQLVLPLVSGN
jgi:hypothetical protein